MSLNSKVNINDVFFLFLGLLQEEPEIDRSHWLREALKEFPEIKEIQERIRPLHRAIIFSKIYRPGKQQVKEKLSREIIIQLIMQHMKAKGYHDAQKILEKESGVKCKHSFQLFFEKKY